MRTRRRWMLVGLVGTALVSVAINSKNVKADSSGTEQPSRCSTGPTGCSTNAQAAPSENVPGHAQHVAAMSGHNQVVEIAVTSDGFVPASVNVRAGHPVKLVVTRKVEPSCATDIVIKDLQINRPLPLGKTVELEFTPAKPGKIRFACAMDMIAGEIVVQ